MGAEGSKEEFQARLDAERTQERQLWEQQMAIVAQQDSRTKVPHLLIELRNLGYIEICGKNIGGIYEKLDEFFRQQFRAQETTHVMRKYPTEECGCCIKTGYTMMPKEPFDDVCDKNYVTGQQQMDGTVSQNGVYLTQGNEGENNMGMLAMVVVNFMTNKCGWGLQLCDGGNNGRYGQFRETQIKFKAPHPLNLMAPHVMIELRQVGYIEVNGENDHGIFEKLEGFVKNRWGGRRYQHDPRFCSLKFITSAFKSRGTEGENNMGLCTMQIVDFMTKECAWTLLTCTGGNFGRTGAMREQQMIFRNDEFVQHGDAHLMVELRDKGYIEVNGTHDAPDALRALDGYYGQMGCSEYQPGFWESSEKYCDKKYQTPGNFYYRQGTTNNLGKRTIELATFLGSQGWMLLLCNGGNISDVRGYSIKREQQIKFTRARPTDHPQAPLLMIEFRTVPTDAGGNYQGYIEINGQNTNGVYEKVIQQLQQTMQASPHGQTHYCDLLLSTPVFRLREAHADHWTQRWEGKLNGESNFGRYTMRLCDFMVDHLGEWDLIVCNGNSIDSVFRVGKDETVNVTGREQQLIFRHRPGGRAVFMADNISVEPFGRPPAQAPKYWKEGSRSGAVGQEIVPATGEEKAWIQQVLDGTFKKKATRDRKEALAERFVVVSALRSECPFLWDRFAKRRTEVHQTLKSRSDPVFVEPKTMAACAELKERCSHPTVGNPSNEAYLLHGSNPTSAISILSTSFKVDFAGAAVGTMFGPGVYMAESSSKSDEYARDESTGGAYDGLYAVLLCRVVLGSSFVVEKPGNYADKCTSGEFESVVGDREKAVGTFREFIIFDEGSIYPEYVAFYRREYAPGEAPPTDSGAIAPVAAAPAPQSMSSPGSRQVQVQIPEGVEPGGKIRVQAPWGDTLEIVVPEGVTSGETITVQG
eukprot:TRINITY_DN92132_c0_g1_i1.p1 TRINITY_DN92132_c0_g1~~TRINITY_DN92132_c0_g1_i1.p1  ORF type:complete len:924 (-),score=158.27 TRINITY_DN92132_c0_g1_i1:133-2904(-)